MAQANYWQRDWFESGYFPEVWFAPADETDVPGEELRPGGGGSKPKRKKERPIRSNDDRDMMEVLAIITSTGLLWHSQTASRL